MNVKKITASSAREALRNVKELLGPDAIILSNRAVPDGVEIMAVAASDMEMIASVPVKEQSRAQPSDDYTVELSASSGLYSTSVKAVPESKPKAAPVEQKASLLASRPIPKIDLPVFPNPVEPAKSAEIVPVEVMEEIRSLRKIVEQHLAGFAWGEAVRSEPVKTEILRQMLGIGFSPTFVRQLLTDLPKDLEASKALAWTRAAVDRTLLTVRAEDSIVDRGGVYALVGPTGVGKTTTTAKLAARCVLRYGASKVALVTTDGYRIGAHEQLRIYGRILGISVCLAKDAEELRQTLFDLKHKHMVLIDTMGMSQRDRMVEEQMAMFNGNHVKRLLLLSATGRGDTLDDVVRAYSGPDLVGCILSKVDEAASLASVLDVMIRHKLPLHYVSNGQRVPEDLHTPNRMYLLHRAFKDLPHPSPHRLDGLEPGLVMANEPEMVAIGGSRG